MSLWKCILAIFSFSLGPFHRHCEKSSDRKYVLLRQADVKQKCCKVSVIGKKSFFVIFKTSGWLLHRTALKHDLLSTYLWLYVRLANFPYEGIRIKSRRSWRHAFRFHACSRWFQKKLLEIIRRIRKTWWGALGFFLVEVNRKL